MNDALFVSGVEGVSELNADFNGALHGDGAQGKHLVEGLSDEQLHRYERTGVVLLDGVDGANAGMAQGRGGAGFAKEALESLRVLLVFLGDEFESDAPAELGVFRFVDDAHAAGAEFAENPVVGNRFVDHVRLGKKDVRRSVNAGQCAQRRLR